MDQNEIQPHEDHPEYENILASVFQGMSVYDSEGDRIGTVEAVFMGSSHSEARGAAQASVPDQPTDILADRFRDALSPSDQLPDTLKDRLYYDGFVRVDNSKLLARDRYVLPEQIEAVEGERVILKVPYRDLVKTAR